MGRPFLCHQDQWYRTVQVQVPLAAAPAVLFSNIVNDAGFSIEFPVTRSSTFVYFPRCAHSSGRACRTANMAGGTAAVVDAVADEESATLLNRLLAVEKRQWDAPTNFHHASIAVCLDPLHAMYLARVACSAGALIVMVQLFVIVSVWVGIGFNTCQASTECTAGFWCKHSRARCDLCILQDCLHSLGWGCLRSHSALRAPRFRRM